MTAIYKRELKSYFTNFTGYVFVVFLLILTGVFTMVVNFTNLYPNFEYTLSSISFVFLIAIPLLTMRSMAEERRQKTDQLLYSLPLGMTEIVMGKYLALVTVLGIPMAVMCIYPPILSLFGSVNVMSAYSGIVGFFLLGAALLAIGLFMSSLTENQIVAAVLSFGVIIVSYLISDIANVISPSSYTSFIALTVLVVVVALIAYNMTKNTIVPIVVMAAAEVPLILVYFLNPAALEGAFQNVMRSLAVFTKFNNFFYGMFDLTAVLYFLSVIALFICFSVQSLEKRRWS